MFQGMTFTVQRIGGWSLRNVYVIAMFLPLFTGRSPSSLTLEWFVFLPHLSSSMIIHFISFKFGDSTHTHELTTCHMILHILDILSYFGIIYFIPWDFAWFKKVDSNGRIFSKFKGVANVSSLLALGLEIYSIPSPLIPDFPCLPFLGKLYYNYDTTIEFISPKITSLKKGWLVLD